MKHLPLYFSLLASPPPPAGFNCTSQSSTGDNPSVRQGQFRPDSKHEQWQAIFTDFLGKNLQLLHG
ncbi:MAG: hypothetical protein RI993_205 [Pseudomonadota bacterium]|jgi:hypothetical protein